MFKDLSALSDTDLEMFGIKNAETRQDMVAKLSNTTNQDINFDKYVLSFTEFIQTKSNDFLNPLVDTLMK